MQVNNNRFVDNEYVKTLLFKDEITIDLEFPSVVRSLEMLSDNCLRQKFKEFSVLYKSYIHTFGEDHSGMCCVDLFAFWYVLDIIKPKAIFEYGTYHGGTTWLIRQTLQTSKIIILNPFNPMNMIKDENTMYFTEDKFENFERFDISQTGLSKDDISNSLAFFEFHTNAIELIKDAYIKGFKHVMFNNNYPEGCGSHLTLQQVNSKIDNRHSTQAQRNVYKKFLMKHTTQMIIFPNIIGSQVKTQEGTFNNIHLFKESHDLEIKLYSSGIEGQPEVLEYFDKHSLRYRWVTYVKLKNYN